MTKNLVVARFKDSPEGEPRFTRSATIEELVEEIMKSIPVDKVYFMVPNKDGKGFLFREAGLITLDILSEELLSQPTASPPPSLKGSISHDHSLVDTEVETPMEKTQPKPPQALQTAFRFDSVVAEPRPQADLLKERGLEQGKSTPKKRGRKTKLTNGEEALPNPPKGGGTVKVTGFNEATPEQAAASSHFGEKF